MSRRQAGVGDRFTKRLNNINTKHLDRRVNPLELAKEIAAGAERATTDIQAAAERIEHPVIESPRYTTEYRVSRRYRSRDHGDVLELIYETNDRQEAIREANREKWAAFVTNRHSRQEYFNFHQTETRA